jgi:hypothetical protein
VREEFVDGWEGQEDIEGDLGRGRRRHGVVDVVVVMVLLLFV